MSFLIEKWEEMVRRQDEQTGPQAPIDDTKRAIMMDACLVELERRRAQFRSARHVPQLEVNHLR